MPSFRVAAAVLIALVSIPSASAQAPPQAKTANGVVQGVIEPSGVRVFRGIPFAAPPVGDLRWREPQPVKSWAGVRPAEKFAAQCMQRRVFSDMVFRASGTSEDCLYLNVWRPAAGDRLPVLVYFFGGGFLAGDGSEPRYDGESMAKRGIVALTVNYRLNVFGFFAHPELTKESPHHGSGNQGLLDQVAALRWVQQNIAAFGGDPRRVTIAGESAGSIAVSALMASPLSRPLIAGAIGESGAMIKPTLPPVPLAEGEKTGESIATALNVSSLAALRALPAEQVLEITAKQGAGPFNVATIDGYFLPKAPVEIFAAGEQAKVPLLAGWNSGESAAVSVLGRGNAATVDTYGQALQRLYGDQSADVLKAYPAASTDEVERAATDLASDRFIAYSTWRWTHEHAASGKPVYRYFYSRPRPAAVPDGRGGPAPAASRYAAHSAEIEYAMGNLATNKAYAWTPEDYKVSELMERYFANFIKSGDPNGNGLPKWAPLKNDAPQYMRIDVEPRLEVDPREQRYRLLDRLYANAAPAAAQGRAGGRGGGPVKSPEVLPDRRVTFRLRAPDAKAAAVTLGGKRLEMQKDDQGVWSVTSDPLAPDIYTYSMVIDGTTINDPSNKQYQTSFGSFQTMFSVPGPKAWLPAPNVPRGAVARHAYHSAIANDDREFYVYTPPGYDAHRAQPYPVLYILHGLGDDAERWVGAGAANVILDNLIAAQKAVPMVMVSPLGYGTPQGPAAGRGPENVLGYSRILIDEVMPVVDKAYNVAKDRNQRAIAGLSMGGAESLYVGLNNLDKFAWIASFSGALLLLPGTELSPESAQAAAAPAPARGAAPATGRAGTTPQTLKPETFAKAFPKLDAKANSQIRLLWIVCGTADGLIAQNRQFKSWLKSKNVQFTEQEVPEMAHVWPLWRQNLTDLAPRLFQKK